MGQKPKLAHLIAPGQIEASGPLPKYLAPLSAASTAELVQKVICQGWLNQHLQFAVVGGG